jgi:protein-S-isoprenylcysteine O-methyltransferase Ste14
MEQKRRFPPPVYLVLTLIVMSLLNYYLPIVRWWEPPASYAGLILIVLGTWMTGYSARLFAQAGTPLIPFERTTTLITYGLYRFTRNR